MATKLTYTHDELLADHQFTARNRRGDTLFHGGFDAHGDYLPPRSLNRVPAIKAWSARVAAAGNPTVVITREDVRREFFPNVQQTQLLLRNGCRDAMTRILTMIGITEGFGNDGIRAFPQIDFQPHFKEPIDEACIGHLYKGLFEAHGNDEAGRGDEQGHDVMWYEIRDAALNKPKITKDMFENLPLAPPPGYTGPAKASPEALTITSGLMNPICPQLNPMIELLITALANILVVELMAYDAFQWAKEVLGDPQGSAAPQWAPQMVDYIQQDENIHVAYLQCALSEARCRTFVGQDGSMISGKDVVDAVCRKVIRIHTGDRAERMAIYRMKQIRTELAGRTDGARILSEFARLGPVPPERYTPAATSAAATA